MAASVSQVERRSRSVDTASDGFN